MAEPSWHNGPVTSFGLASSELLIVGLAPGLKGANRTGRPFTGDYAGDLLYPMLLRVGLATGNYNRAPDDHLKLINCRITNAVRCVPPKNKPTTSEIITCNGFLKQEILQMKRLKVLLALGHIAHNSVLRALDVRPSRYKFQHGSIHLIEEKFKLADSYHCSRYNTNTGRLTEKMFHEILLKISYCLQN